MNNEFSTTLLTVSEAAQLTGIPAYRIRRMLADGTLSGIQPGRPKDNPSRAYKWYISRQKLLSLAP